MQKGARIVQKMSKNVKGHMKRDNGTDGTRNFRNLTPKKLQ